MSRNEALTLLGVLVRFPYAVWEVYAPSGALDSINTSNDILDLLVSTPEFIRTFPHDLPIRWGEDGSVLVQVNGRPWRRFLRLRHKGRVEMNEEQVDEFIGYAAQGKQADDPEVDEFLQELADDAMERIRR